MGMPPQRRYKVDLELEFPNELCASAFGSRMGAPRFQELCGSQMSNVQDPEIFCDCSRGTKGY